MVNVLQAMIFTRNEKLVLTPTYHVFRMYVPFQDATLLPVQFDAGVYKFRDIELPRVDAIAARDTQGKVWLSLTNLDPTRAANIEASIPGVKAARGETLGAPKVDSVNTFEAPTWVAPKKSTVKVAGGKVSLSLPPASVTVLSIE
jgi:alpha-L-arabinofuranosidase